MIVYNTDTRMAWASLLLGCWVLGCGESGDEVTLPLDVEAVEFAVVRSDRESTSIAVLDEMGEVLNPSVYSSSSQEPGLVAPLSGDVVLSDAVRKEEMKLIVVDRLGTDVLSLFDLESESIAHQLRVAPGDFSTNPQDVAVVDQDRAWVSRFSVDTSGNLADNDRGNDVVELNPSTFTLTGRRVSLDQFTGTATATRDEGDVEVEVFARPGLITMVGDTLVVGLTLMSLQFDAATSGRVALINVDSTNLTALDLPEVSRNCGRVVPVPGSSEEFVVACTGFARPFGEETQVRATAGIYRISLTGVDPEIVGSWEPRTDEPLAVQNVVPLDGTRFVGVVYGTFGESGDAVYVIDMQSQEAELLFSATEAFSVGRAAYNADAGLLLIPDASEVGGGLRSFSEDAQGGFSENGVQTFSDGPLPPRQVYRLTSGK